MVVVVYYTLLYARQQCCMVVESKTETIRSSEKPVTTCLSAKQIDTDVLVALPYRVRVLISMMCTVNEKKMLVMYLILALSRNFSQLIYSKD
jgi:hypothetical protein